MLLTNTTGTFRPYLREAALRKNSWWIPVYMNGLLLADRKIPGRSRGIAGQALGTASYMNARQEGRRTTSVKKRTGTSWISAAGLKFAGLTIATPGHTPGGICWLMRDERRCSPETPCFRRSHRAHRPQLRRIRRRDTLDHGEADAARRRHPDISRSRAPSSIADERTGNPFLEPFNEPEEDYDPDRPPIIIHPES